MLSYFAVIKVSTKVEIRHVYTLCEMIEQKGKKGSGIFGYQLENAERGAKFQRNPG